MNNEVADKRSVYEKIYDTVRKVPYGRVTSYGRIATIVGRCTPRMVGYAMAALPVAHDDVPWHRVINSQGSVSQRKYGQGEVHQQQMLEAEGIHFDERNRLDWKIYGWPTLDTEELTQA